MNSNNIPPKLYKNIQESIPIACVDAVIKTDDGVLLGIRKRRNNPALGKLWLIGGRVLYGESLEHAIKRKVKEETGLNVRIIKQIGVYTVFTGIQKRHNIAVDYLVEKTGGALKLNGEYSTHIFIKKLDKKLHPYVYAVLRDSGVFGKFLRRTKKEIDYFVE